MKLALKIDIDTYRGTLEGVPQLVELLRRHHAAASFLFTLGPDRTGRALPRILGSAAGGWGSPVGPLSRYGIRTLLQGTVLPGPDIGQRCPEVLRGVRDAGHEVGIRCHSYARWLNRAAVADAGWTEREMRRACDRFADIFGSQANVHGAAGWQMNPHALRLTQRLGFHYASDCRGETPFVPVWNGEVVGCPQLPTTLPTLDELMADGATSAEEAADGLLALTAREPRRNQVFTLRAELEGIRLAAVFERLVESWRSQGYELTPMRELFEAVRLAELPRHEIRIGVVPGNPCRLTLQGPEFLADLCETEESIE